MRAWGAAEAQQAGRGLGGSRAVWQQHRKHGSTSATTMDAPRVCIHTPPSRHPAIPVPAPLARLSDCSSRCSGCCSSTSTMQEVGAGSSSTTIAAAAAAAATPALSRAWQGGSSSRFLGHSASTPRRCLITASRDADYHPHAGQSPTCPCIPHRPCRGDHSCFTYRAGHSCPTYRSRPAGVPCLGDLAYHTGYEPRTAIMPSVVLCTRLTTRDTCAKHRLLEEPVG